MQINKNVIQNIILNIISVALPIAVLQMVVYPLIAANTSADEYGLCLTMLALFNICPFTFGNVINNIRLLFNQEYETKKIQGDFGVLLIFSGIVNVIIVFFSTIYYEGAFNIENIILVIIIAIIWLSREYFIVGFQIKLDYKKILINNIILTGGYLLGTFLFYYGANWRIIYVLGQGLSCLHAIVKTDLWREPIVKTIMFPIVMKETVWLTIAIFLKNIINYADKLLLYPILGGGSVAIYSVATLFGKIISMLIGPMNSVALSYLSKIKKRQDKLFFIVLIGGAGIAVLSYVITIVFSRPILGFLYPQFVDAAMQFIFITAATTAVRTMTSMIHPFVLKYCEMKWQIVVNSIVSISYVIASIIMVKIWGLYGFCIAALIVECLRMLILLLVYIKTKERGEL